ncbi:AIR carboxylase family protein, partial [Microbacterium sp. T32]|uniref:AIR carboxylase family protein n=1 Tax=Microbacterium sp. T32 TaxID=1776083 RepID=UPI000A773124
SIVQMPAGIPVATVSINGAKNAGLLAARILGSTDAEIGDRVEQYAADLEAQVEEKNRRLKDAL